MNWHPIYDIGAEGVERFLPFVFVGLGLLAAATGLHFWARKRKQRSFMAVVTAIAAILVGGLGYGLSVWDHQRLAARLIWTPPVWQGKFLKFRHSGLTAILYPAFWCSLGLCPLLALMVIREVGAHLSDGLRTRLARGAQQLYRPTV